MAATLSPRLSLPWRMRLAISCGYAGMGLGTDTLDLVQEAERLGYAQAWGRRACGAPTVLAWLAGQTTSIGLGAGVMQIPARTPAMTAMTAATLDTLSGGRFHLGLGCRVRRSARAGTGCTSPLRWRAPASTSTWLDGAAPRDTSYAGSHFTLPLAPGEGVAAHHPAAPRRPAIYLAAVGLHLAGEVADGWLGIFLSPEHSADQGKFAVAGREAGARVHGRPDGRLRRRGVGVHVVVTDDLGAGQDYTALYIGGMGSREQNFYNALARRMGYEEAADTIQDLYLAGVRPTRRW